MKFIKSMVIANVWSKIRMLTVLLFVMFLTSACSRINIEAAKSLSVTGRDAASQTKQNVLVSYKDYLRARDSEALLNGFSGTTNSSTYQETLNEYNEIQKEFTKRSVVFEKLADLYEAFGELANFDAGGQTEKALGDLSSTVNEYAKLLKQEPPIPTDTGKAISMIGGLVAAEIQKAKIKEASIRIQAKVKALVKLLEDQSVRNQLVGYQEFLFSNRKAAFVILWDKGVYDPKPIFDDFGEDAGLTARKDVTEKMGSNSDLGKAITEVIDKRLEMKLELVGEGYDASIEALKQLIEGHKNLERGEPLDLARLRVITAELRSIAALLTKTDTPISQ